VESLLPRIQKEKEKAADKSVCFNGLDSESTIEHEGGLLPQSLGDRECDEAVPQLLKGVTVKLPKPAGSKAHGGASVYGDP
jgi:hypothetical protein